MNKFIHKSYLVRALELIDGMPLTVDQKIKFYVETIRVLNQWLSYFSAFTLSVTEDRLFIALTIDLGLFGVWDIAGFRKPYQNMHTSQAVIAVVNCHQYIEDLFL